MTAETRFLAALCLASLLPAPTLAEEAEIRWTFTLSGREAGAETLRHLADGGWEDHFSFADRGRGPDETTRFALAPDGCFSRLEVAGVDYLKSPVSERFERGGGKASWQSANDKGSAEVAGVACYLPLEAASETSAVLARALLAAPGGKVRVLPAGEATIEKLGTLEIRLAGKDGTRTRTVRQVAISGLGFTPQRLWLDEPGGTLFASNDGWSGLIRQGWEEAMPQIVAAQQIAVEERERAAAARLGRRPEHGFAITGALLFDSETGKSIPATTVVVQGERIAAVGPDGKVAIPPGAEVIEAKGKALLPGLWDLHTHLSADQGLLFIASGVTSVRDLANDTEMLGALDKRWQSGAAIGPRVVKAGFLDGPGPYAGPTKVLVSTVEEVNREVDHYASLGYEQIKIYSSIKPELVPAIVARAKMHGLRVSGHIPAFMTAEQAVRAGYDEIQHINYVALNFLFDKVQDTRTPARFTQVAEHAVEIDPKSEKFQAFVRLLKEKGTAVDPTVNIFEEMFLTRSGQPSPVYGEVLDRLPSLLRRALESGAGGLPVPEGMDARYRASYRRLLEMVKALWDAGVPIEAGTDALAGLALDRELELYVEAGIPAPDALRLATLGAAKILKHADARGSIVPGKLADLALVDGDPAVRISDLHRTVITVKGGTIYRAADLWREVGVKPVE